MTYAAYQNFAWGWAFLGLVTFLYLQKIVAPFGRHTKAGWGPTIDNRLGWCLMELWVLMVFGVLLWNSPRTLDTPARLMCGLFVTHYVHRSLIFPFRLRTSGKRMPVVIMLSAMGFNSVNGFLMGYYFGYFAEYPADYLTSLPFLSGLTLFVVGMYLNISTDYYLIGLRQPGDTRYVVPQGGLFNRISCPNHFGEIVEWSGFALLSTSLPGLIFAWWTFANLAPRALAHHAWYKQQFNDYPEERKALIPFLW